MNTTANQNAVRHTGVEMVQIARYVKLPLFEAVTGYSQKAVRRKIEEGHWLEGKEFRRAPDGHILIDMEAYYRWVESGNGKSSLRLNP